MSARQIHTFRRTLSRLFREAVTALMLLSFLLLDVPISFPQDAAESSPTKLPGCCAARLAARQQAEHVCGCSAKLREAGKCCCQGRSMCGRSKRKADDEGGVFLSSCDCSGPQAKLLSAGPPRIKAVPPGLTGTDSLESLCPVPTSKPASLDVEPETPPPRSDSASIV